jgi:hypothetical protein
MEGANVRHDYGCSPGSATLPPLLPQSLRSGFVAMASAHLWPAGGIVATLLSPFGPAMVDRLVSRLRHMRLVGRVFRFLIPEEQGPQSTQRDEAPEVGLNAVSILLLRDALRDVVQEGLRAAVDSSELTAEIRRQNTLLQQLVDAVEGMRRTHRTVPTIPTLSQAPSRELANCGVDPPLGVASGGVGFNNLVAPAMGLHFYAVLVTTSFSKSETKTSPTKRILPSQASLTSSTNGRTRIHPVNRLASLPSLPQYRSSSHTN